MIPQPKKRLTSLFKAPKRLWVIFSLRLSLILCLATVIPMLLLYTLIRLDLIEASYGIDTGQLAEIDPDLPAELTVTEASPQAAPDAARIIARLTGGLPAEDNRSRIQFDPELGVWQLSYDLSNVIFVTSIFDLHVEMPAWIAIGALPLLSLVVGVLLSIWLSRSVTQPFTRLAGAARAIGRRDLGHRIHTSGSQELQDLAQSFNRMAAELEQAETARSNMMADVAHELRTPLAVLDGSLRALLDGVHELNEEEVALLYEQTHHLNRLIDDLRSLSLAEANQLSLDLQPVDLASLVEETAAHFDLVAQERGIKFKVKVQDALTHPALDKDRARQVLHNLLSNAFRYTPDGGWVEISAKRMPESGLLEISVTDSGAGIAAEDLPHIFDRFYRSETAAHVREGTGLGLAIVHAIVKALGGRVCVKSAGPGQGSRFTVEFPLACDFISKAIW
jgi:signal transduction histidine kinase